MNGDHMIEFTVTERCSFLFCFEKAVQVVHVIRYKTRCIMTCLKSTVFGKWSNY